MLRKNTRLKDTLTLQEKKYLESLVSFFIGSFCYTLINAASGLTEPSKFVSIEETKLNYQPKEVNLVREVKYSPKEKNRRAIKSNYFKEVRLMS
jgi:hypothetical protein